MSGRVYERLCVRDGLAYSVDAEIVDHVDATLLQFTSEVAPANLGRVVGDTLGVLSALARRPVSAGELARVREGYRFSLLAQLDDATAMAEWFGAALLFREPLLPSARLALMSRVSARDVMLRRPAGGAAGGARAGGGGPGEPGAVPRAAPERGLLRSLIVLPLCAASGGDTRARFVVDSRAGAPLATGTSVSRRRTPSGSRRARS